MKDIKSILKEATQDLLSEDVLKEIEDAFNTTVSEKVQIHVTKALTEQDEDYSKKLEHLLEAIDADHTNKLEKPKNRYFFSGSEHNALIFQKNT